MVWGYDVTSHGEDREFDALPSPLLSRVSTLEGRLRIHVPHELLLSNNLQDQCPATLNRQFDSTKFMGGFLRVEEYVLSVPGKILDTFKQGRFGRLQTIETWKAFGIAGLMFVVVSYAALSSLTVWMTYLAEMLVTYPERAFESLNRSDVEQPLANSTG